MAETGIPMPVSRTSTRISHVAGARPVAARTWAPRWLFAAFQLHANHFVGISGKIVGQMLSGGHKQGLPGAHAMLLRVAVRGGELGVLIRKENDNALWMAVHDGLFVGTVADAQHPHPIILELHLVVFGVNLDGIVASLRGWGVESFDVAAFKERFGLTRKLAIPILEWLDSERVTRREGDRRRLARPRPGPTPAA